MNETASDVKPKLEPKVTVEKALEVLKPKVEALLKETLAGFELNEGDKKSRKRIFGAMVQAGAAVMIGEEKLSYSSISRRAQRGVSAAFSELNPSTGSESDDDSGETDDQEQEGGED